MDHAAPPDNTSREPRVWRAERREVQDVARLLVAFRDHLGFDWPSDNAFLAGVERLIDDPATEYLLGAPDPSVIRGAVGRRGMVHVWFRWVGRGERFQA